jgi:hypothetical protein
MQFRSSQDSGNVRFAEIRAMIDNNLYFLDYWGGPRTRRMTPAFSCGSS